MTNLLIILNVLLLLISGYANANNHQELDSLLLLSSKVQESPEKVDLLNQISTLYSFQPNNTAKDSAKIYALLAIDLARSIDYRLGLAEAQYDLGKYYVGVTNNPAKATHHLLESLDLFTQSNNYEGVGKCYMQLGLVSYILQYFEAAVKNLKLSLEVDDIPTSKYLLALTYTELDSFTLAKKYFSLSIEDYKIQNSSERLDECYLWLGRLHLKTGLLDSAFYYMKRTIGSLEGQNDPFSLVRPYAFIAEVYFESNDPDKAIFYAEQSYEIEISKTTQQKDDISLIQATKVLNNSYILKGSYRKAHFYLDLCNKIDNRFRKGSIKQKVADMQSMFAFDQEMNLQKVRQQKDKEIAQQQIAKDKILRNALYIGSGLLLLLLILLYSRFNLKKRANAALRDLNETITKEKKRSDDLLLNILPEEIANELKENGKAAAKDFQKISILFTDFKEFTQLSEKLSAIELVAEINHCFKAFDEICETYDVEKIKTIGDSYMAAGGLPVPTDDATKNIVLAAIDMADFVINRKRNRDAEGEISFEMRAGIHTGNVVAGIVGVKKFQYDIWGDTVNTASRIENNGEEGKVNVSQTTYNLLRDDPEFTFESRGKIEAKGKGEIEMYFVSRNVS